MTSANREDWVRKVVTKIAGKSADGIPSDADLEEAIGLDSLGRLEVLSEIEDEFDFFFDDTALTASRTIGRMLEEIDRHTTGASKEPAE